MSNNKIKMKRIYGADLDPNDEWALLKQWEKEALEEMVKEKNAQEEISKKQVNDPLKK